MKPLITLLLISFWINGNAQIKIKGAKGVTRHGNTVNVKEAREVTIGGDDSDEEDSITVEKLIGDSIMIEYKYPMWIEVKRGHFDAADTNVLHSHIISLCKIITYKGNRKSTIASNIKAIYSPVECSADCPKLWLKRLYECQKKK